MTAAHENIEDLEPTIFPEEPDAEPIEPQTDVSPEVVDEQDPDDLVLVQGVRLSYVKLFEKRPILRNFLRMKAATIRDPDERKKVLRLIGDGQAIDALLAHISTMKGVPKDGNKFLDFLKNNWAQILQAILAIVTVL